MPKSKEQNYYCIVSKKKRNPYELVIRIGTNHNHVTRHLIQEGYLVLRCLSPLSVRKYQSYNDITEFYKERPNSKWSKKAFEFMKTIKLLEEDM
jgi:hypothetical protein